MTSSPAAVACSAPPDLQDWSEVAADGIADGNPGYYENPTTNSRLISPIIDLTNVTAAELSFAHAIDIPVDDTATVTVLNTNSDEEIVASPFPLTLVDHDDIFYEKRYDDTLRSPCALLGSPCRRRGQSIRHP